LRMGVLRKSGKLARFIIIFPAKFSSDNNEIFQNLILTVTGR